MLGRARGRSSPPIRRSRARIELVAGEAERLPFDDGEFDALTFTYLLRYVDDPGATMRELARVVKPGGTIASLEFAVPRRPITRALWTLYTRIGLPALGRLASRDWYEVGRFLGPSISGFYRRYPLAALADLWRRAGIDAVETRRDEPRRRRRDVGGEGGRRRRGSLSARRSTRCGPAAGATSSRCCIRPTRRGT